MQQGFTGISFPFRIGVKGGVAMSSTSPVEVPHIVEAIKQILLTRPRERGMEYFFHSDLDTMVFEPNDTSTHTMLAYQVRKALSELEDRIEVKSVDVFAQESSIIANIDFKVLVYNATFTTQVKVGDLNVQNPN